MGYISAKYSNLTIITADDPRTEKVEDINKLLDGVISSDGLWASACGVSSTTPTTIR